MSILKHGRISRASLAQELGLTRTTISAIVQPLIDAGLVEELDLSDSTIRGGRRARFLGIRGDAGIVAGLEISRSYRSFVLMDLAGRVRAEKPLPAMDTESDLLSVLGVAAKFIHDEAARLGLPLLGAGIGIPAILDPQRGQIVHCDQFGLWDYPVAQLARPLFPGPVVVENDARCCAWGELWGPEAPTDFCFLFFRRKASPEAAGPGFGLGASIGGRVHIGAHSFAGELYWPFRTEINQRYKEAPQVFSEYPDVLADLATLVTVYDPALFLVGNHLSHRADLIRQILTAPLLGKPALLPELEVRASTLGPEEVAKGAAIRFLFRFFSIPMVGQETDEVRSVLDRLVLSA